MMKKTKFICLASILIVLSLNIQAQNQPQVSGVFPHLAMVADQTPRTEAGTGALFPWANRLWVITYVAHMQSSGSGTGLYEINEKLELRKRPESVVGTYANLQRITTKNGGLVAWRNGMVKPGQPWKKNHLRKYGLLRLLEPLFLQPGGIMIL